MVAFVTRMPYGIAGDVTRQSQAKIEPQVLNNALPFASYGIFGKIASGKFVPITTGDVAANVYGALIRPYPVTGLNGSDALGTSVPFQNGVADVLRSGYFNAKCNNGTPAIGGVVYVRVAAATGPKPLGGIEATADGVNAIVVAGATFNGAADASGNCEIAFNI